MRSAPRRSRATLILGLLALAGWLATASQVLVRLSPDGKLSSPIWRAVPDVRIFILCVAIALLLGFALRLRRVVMVLTLALGAVLWSGAVGLRVLSERYPTHLLFQPSRLLAAALGEEMLLSDFTPGTYLVVPQHAVPRAKFPVINIHAHFRNWYLQRTPAELLRIMDACNLRYLVNLDGRLAGDLQEALARYSEAYPDRFMVFATFPFGKRLRPDVFRQQVEQVREARALGARGLKIWKNLGFKVRDLEDRLLPIDDLRLEPLWQALGELKMPILFHVGDSIANYGAVDRYNEQYEWLRSAPEWAYFDKPTPPLHLLLQQFERLASRHPELTFILAHVGNVGENLAIAGGILDRHPNVFMDISAKVQELGRQPRAARAFFLRYQDRLLFGTDGNPDEAVYRGHFRFLETADEYFDYPFWGLFNFGRWKIYGIELPDGVLRNIYHDNAARILGLPLLPADAG